MQWWAWVAVGAILLGSELTIVDAQFYLVFLGTAALAAGLLELAGLLPSPWAQWLVFTVISVASMLGFRRRIYERMRRTLPAMASGPAGETVTLAVPLRPGESARIEYRGSSWNAVNGGDSIIAAGGRARIARVSGLTLVVHADV